MKILPNIIPGIKMMICLRAFNKNAKIIDQAKAAGDFEKEREYILKSTSTFGAQVLDQYGAEIHIQGRENIPDEGPVVLIGNHQGYADIAAYCAAFTKFQFAFVAKNELSKLPIYGTWINRIRSVLIERDDPKASLMAIKEGVGLIEQGFSLAIFPEGTRSQGPVPGPFMKGSTKLATRPGVPIVPVSLQGTYKMFEETGCIKGARIDMIIHPPIETKDISRSEERELPEKVEQIVTDGVRELVKLQESLGIEL